MFGAVSAIVIGVNTAAAFLLPIFPEYIFVQCLWKDIYILIMFKQLWSMIHATIDPSKAKYLYGILFAAGTVGSCLGSTVPGLFAVSLGSSTLFLFTLPIYCLLFLAYRAAFKQSLVPKILVSETDSRTLSLAFKNRFILGILFLVILMQVSIGLMDYRFNLYLEKSIFDPDLRTSYCGWLFGFTNFLSLGLQAIGSFLIIRAIGVRKTHLVIPFILLLSTLSFWILPSFILISCAYVFLKAMDFSLFSVSREMLYIPLTVNEKFRVKAIIDVFAYRSSKALVSFGILALQIFAGSYLISFIDSISIGIFIVWMCVVVFLIYPTFTLRKTS